MLRPLAITLSIVALWSVAGGSVSAEDPWPAEPIGDSVNLTPIEGPEPNDFWEDLSGAAWNPLSRTLWLCRNGPSGSSSS